MIPENMKENSTEIHTTIFIACLLLQYTPGVLMKLHVKCVYGHTNKYDLVHQFQY